ncbi:hypothetical protein Tco_0037272, partial [Tanacetum coccineum]
MAKSNKKKQPAMMPKAKGLNSKVPNEQQQNTSGTDDRTRTKPGVLDVPKYDSKSEKESWGDSDEEDDDDEDDFEDDDGDNDDADDNEGNDDDEAGSEITESDREEIPNLNQSNVEQSEEEEYSDQRAYTPVLDAQKTDDPSDILSVHYTSDSIPEIISATTVPPPPPFFNPLQQEATPIPTPTTSKATTSTHALPNFDFVFKFNKRVTNLEKDLSEMKQVDQYVKALASILAIDEKNEYIGLVDISMRTIIKEEVTTQLHQILPQAVSNFVTLVIEKNVAES